MLMVSVDRKNAVYFFYINQPSYTTCTLARHNGEIATASPIALVGNMDDADSSLELRRHNPVYDE